MVNVADVANNSLGVGTGTALLLGAVLGPGVLVLPRLAAEAAGPASVLAWAGLLALSVPVAVTFATLGARHPDGGGVASFAARAFGRRTSTAVGLWFYCAVPIGMPAAAMIGGDYVAQSAGLGHLAAVLVACLLLAAAFAANAAGLRTSGRLQLGLVCLLVLLIVAAIAVSAPHLRATGFQPFAPHGVLGVARAAGVLLWAFAGWEAVTYLSVEFAGARGGLPWATRITLAVVGVLYLGLAICTVGVPAATASRVPLTALLSSGIGAAARPITGIAALFLTFGAMNAYVAGASRLGAALARDGVLPRRLVDEAAPGETPQRSLALLAVLSVLTTVPALVWSIDLDILMRMTSACLAAVLVVGVAAAARLLPPGHPRRTAAAATVFCCAALACCGLYLLLPALLALIPALTRGRSAPAQAAPGRFSPYGSGDSDGSDGSDGSGGQVGEAGAEGRRTVRGEVAVQAQAGDAAVRVDVQADVADLG